MHRVKSPPPAPGLPMMALGDPVEASRHAQSFLEAGSSPRDKTYALHALGIIDRDAGRVSSALRKLRQGVRLAIAHDLADRHVDLAATLGTALAMTGKRAAAIAALEQALAVAEGVVGASVHVRLAAVHCYFGDYMRGVEAGKEALRLAAADDNHVWMSRAHNNVASALMSLGRITEAEEHLTSATTLLGCTADHAYEATIIRQGQAFCAYQLGDLPRALRLFYDVRDRYREMDMLPPELVRDLTVVQLGAGLTDDAAESAEDLVKHLERDGQAALRRADGFVTAAAVQIAAGRSHIALDLARRAARSSRKQGNVKAERHARIVMLRAQFASGKITKRHARAAAALAAELEDRHSSERLDALVLAGRMAIATGLADHAKEALTEAAAYRKNGSALRRAAAWYAQGLLSKLKGDRGGVLRACERGLDVLDTHALSLGATELRAHSTVHGSDLAILAGRQVIEDGSAREILRWTERWRATLQALPWPEARDDPYLTAELGKLRAVERNLGVGSDPKQESERRGIEERIRRHVHGRSGDSTARRRQKFAVPALLEVLGDDATLVSIVGVVGERFHVCVARGGRVRHVVGGPIEGIDQEIEYARFALRGAALSPHVAAGPLLRGLEPALSALEATMLGDAGRLLGDGPVVMIPPATLQAAPWGALPSLRDRDFTVAPSAAAWMRAHATPEPEHRRTALIGGPNLTSSAREVSLLAGAYQGANVLDGDRATTEKALAAIDGAWLAHVGAHGRFRRDNPMFSSLELADGPVTVYDFERLRQAPYRLLLTACESGITSDAGADELLGLTASLSGLGTAGVMASVVLVSDQASVGLSMTVHERLREGDGLGAALREARRRADDPVSKATAWAFLPLGAA